MPTRSWSDYWLVGFSFAGGAFVGVTCTACAFERAHEWTGEDVTAAGTVTLAVVTIGLLLMAWYQLAKQTFAQRQWATLQACDRYDSDPVLGAARASLYEFEATGQMTKERTEIRQACRTTFNYFDSIAIGLAQGLYVEEIVEEHLGHIMVTWLDWLAARDDPTIVRFREGLATHYARYWLLVHAIRLAAAH
jgi:hypothetical protein